MKVFVGFFICFATVICCPLLTKAQDVYITVPTNNIFNRTEFTTIQNVLNTRNHTNWRLGFFAPIWPEIQSTSGNNFLHQTLPGVSVPTHVLEWQLKSIGGENAPFRGGDTWPLPYKSFNTASQYWYQPGSTTGGHTPGNVAFNFKITAAKYSAYAFQAGKYSLSITHNYGSSGTYAIEFTPNSFKTFLDIPMAISWLSNTPSKYIEISSLNQYRTVRIQMISDLGVFQLGNTVEFSLHAKTSSASVQFTSSNGAAGTRPVSSIRLSSTNSTLSSSLLSDTWKNYTATTKFKVEAGNRNSFPLQLSISQADLKNYFFEAGTYSFQLNLDAKSTDNTISSIQNTDVTFKVLPLSEITIPTTGNEVNFNFNTAQHYQDGQSKVVSNQLKISNNDTYELYVKSQSNFFTKAGVQTGVNSDILQIGVEGNPLNVFLSSTPKKIISSGIPVLDKDLNLKYTISANSAQSLVAKEKGTYSINVIYSFTAL